MTCRDITAALAHLAVLEPKAAAAEAYTCARLFLSVPGAHDIPVKIEVLWCLSIGLYYTASTAPASSRNVMALQSIVEDHYCRLTSGASDEDIFTPLIAYPEPLSGFLTALSMLPRCLVTDAIETVRTMLAGAVHEVGELGTHLHS